MSGIKIKQVSKTETETHIHAEVISMEADSQKRREEAVSIARLMQMAPELFDALENVIWIAEKWAEGSDRWSKDYEQIRAAQAVLMKARGEIE